MPKKKEWPEHDIETRKVADLVPFANNARTHSEEQIAQLERSIKEWGFTNPVIISQDGTIIAGHGRIIAAGNLGIEEVRCVVANGWTEAQIRAYVIADNQLALNAGWDESLLNLELKSLADFDFDLSLIGFGDLELVSFLADKTDGLTDPDDTPEVQERAITVPGDTWLLGKHRLRCGDSTSADDVAGLLNGVEPHLMVTDPPYGVDYDPGWRNEAGTSQTKRTGKVLNDDRADWRETWALFPGDVAYVWHGALHATTVAESLTACGFDIRSQIIWAKERLVLSRGHYHWQHEPCWYAVRGKGHWAGDRTQTTLWHIPSRDQDSDTVHGTQKPVECMRRPIANNSQEGDAIYEPFSGSGTTIIAGEMEGRHVYAMELDERYCDVIVRRWQTFTGQQATLEGDGRTFDEITEERGAE